MEFLVCGAGLIGKKRINALIDLGISAKNILVYDTNQKALELVTIDNIHKTNRLTDVNALNVIISTPHDSVLDIVYNVNSAKPRILIEKPLGRNISEALKIKEACEGLELSVGFNYRFMSGIIKLKTILESSDLGSINSIRMDLGHGGSPGDDKTWKLNKIISGGGSILDPGIHLIDLLLHLFNKNANQVGIDGVNYWKGFWNTGIEESAMILGRISEIPFQFTTSIVAWRTRFRIEIIGSDGYAIVSGRGRSDGPQVFTSGSRWGWGGNKSQLESEFSEVVMHTDNSIELETKSWVLREQKMSNIKSSIEVMKVYDEILRKANL
jgi:predicted dehydrogenase